jgi:hypothetical protein
LQPNGAGGRVHVSQRGLGTHGIGWIEEHGNASGAGHQFAQEPQPLRPQLCGEKIDAGRVAARPGEADDKTKLDGVLADAEDDRDHGGCSFGRQSGELTARCGDHVHLTLHKLGRQLRQPIDLTFGVAVFDRHVLARDIAGFTEALPKCGHEVRSAGGRAVQKPDHRHR